VATTYRPPDIIDRHGYELNDSELFQFRFTRHRRRTFQYSHNEDDDERGIVNAGYGPQCPPDAPYAVHFKNLPTFAGRPRVEPVKRNLVRSRSDFETLAFDPRRAAAKVCDEDNILCEAVNYHILLYLSIFSFGRFQGFQEHLLRNETRD
jgi:hypothetical protein